MLDHGRIPESLLVLMDDWLGKTIFKPFTNFIKSLVEVILTIFKIYQKN